MLVGNCRIMHHPGALQIAIVIQAFLCTSQPVIEPFSVAVATQMPDSSYKSVIDSRAVTGQLNRGRAATIAELWNGWA